jgi:hypothetical protein
VGISIERWIELEWHTPCIGRFYAQRTNSKLITVSYSNPRLPIIGRQAAPLDLHRGQLGFSLGNLSSAFSLHPKAASGPSSHLIQDGPLTHTTTTHQSAPFIHNSLVGAPLHPIINKIIWPVASFLSPLPSSADGHASFWAEIETLGKRQLRGPALRVLRAHQTALQYNVPLSRA